jgi:predicted nuclease of predicted toxin-antitoxin system
VTILVDMNLSPEWVSFFERESWNAVHWSVVGSMSAPDRDILEWAASRGAVIFTHDLDFGTLLALKSARVPSVVQLRGQETSPARVGQLVVTALKQLKEDLERGALVTIDATRIRARILPLR